MIRLAEADVALHDAAPEEARRMHGHLCLRAVYARAKLPLRAIRRA